MSPPSASGAPTPAREPGPSRAPSRIVERSAGGVVVRVREGANHILLIRDPYGKWGLPKGHLEEDEGPSDAALREVSEETGLDDLILGPDLGEIDWTFSQRGRRIHKFCRFFLIAAPTGEPRPERDEGISECRWLPAEQAMRLVAYENARGIVKRAMTHLVDPPEGSGRGAGARLPWEAS